MFTNIVDFHFHMAVPRVSSALAAVGLKQLPPPMIIGERLNTQGSRKAKQMVLDGDYDGLVSLGRSQAEEGAHCIDVCVATTEKSDELEFMVNLVKRLSLEVEAPLVIDSTDPDVIRAAIRQVPGRPIINSINLEGDGSRFASLAPVMAEYGTPAIALCIGPGGMAKTAKEKLETARLLFEEGQKYGLAPDQYIFDVLTFTLATGQDEFRSAGVETLDGIKLVKKEFPDSFTALGLSNISFGLTPPARRVLNSVFLYHAIRAGLDAAIVNAREIIPYGEIDKKESGLAEDLIFDRGPDALSKFVSYFEGGGGSGSGGGSGARKRSGPEIDASWPPAKRANFRIVNRLADGIAQDVVRAIAMQAGLESSIIPDREGEGEDYITIDAPQSKTHDAAIRVLNESLLPAMKEVGDRFGAGELILPFVLKSAECMKAAVGELERYLVKEEGGASKGKLVLGTVYGDVHDIGKNLVKTIFQNNGYAVYDLGKQVPLQKFLDKIAEVRPDAVGLSALLVSTSRQMQLFVEHARENKMDTPVLCGGAAINSSYINRIAMPNGDKKDALYEPGVFYCNTMFDGLRVMDALVDDARREEMLADWRQGLSKWQARQESLAKAKAAGAGPDGGPGGASPDKEKLERSAVEPVRPPAIPGFMRPGVPTRLQPGDIPMDEVWPLVDTKSLYRLSWGVRGRGAGRESQEDHEKLFLSWQRRIESERMFEPRVVYGYFRCHNRRGGGAVLDVEDAQGGAVSFAFPRSQKAERLCLADYFGKDDVVAFQSVTVGSRVTDTIEEWNRQGMYTDAYYLHGLAVEAAEALAEWTNRRIRSELNLDGGCLRYSWGYPSCPDLAQHALVWRLLEPQHSDMALTESGQIVPEHSTAAIVVHHPESKYFVL